MHVTFALQLCRSAVSGIASDFAFFGCFQPTTLLHSRDFVAYFSSDYSARTRLHCTALLHRCDVAVNQDT